MIKKCGLLGEKLSHSFSKIIHSNFSDEYTYDYFEVKPTELENFIKTADFCGLNVTIPYKKKVIKYLDELSETAKITGSVNTIVKDANGKLIGYNTDCFGFSKALDRVGYNLLGKKVLVLGSGGAKTAVCYVLDKRNIPFTVISRSGTNNYENINKHYEDTNVIINTTPVGMYPNTNELLVNPKNFKKLEFVFDLIYNPLKTPLIFYAEELSVTAENGLYMLTQQAIYSKKLFTGERRNISADEIYSNLKKSMENIVLIGMPGVGKTTVGKCLAEKLNRPFVDTDTLITKKYNMSPANIIETYGVSKFREYEMEAINDVSKLTGNVISLGGGSLENEDAKYLMQKNGIIFWLCKDLDKLDTLDRPLSKINLNELYKVRSKQYSTTANYRIEADDTPEKTANKIIEIWSKR